MQVRVLNISRNGKRYCYAQLVESYRRESDGMPMHRVIRNLGPADSIEVHNLREALAATRKGKRVVASRAAEPSRRALPKILTNLRYLDAAVLLSLWDEWQLSQMLEEILPRGSKDMAPGAVLAALTMQRALDPGSKLYATRWLPKSALPELLHVSAAAFNNSRLHRVLDEHTAIELAQLYRAKDAVEKDFQTIKSFVELRPIRHQTDSKVRAHVTICMLALLLERTLHHRLKGQYTTGAALEELEGCRLNRLAARADGTAAYALTEKTPEQSAILRLLRLQELGDPDQVADRIMPC